APTRAIDDQDDSPLTAKRVMGIAVLLHHANEPGVDDEGNPRMKLWPDAFAINGRTTWFAYAVGVTEVLGGAFCFLGLLTRLAAFCLTGVSLGILWFTQVGPAMQGGDAVLGFLPNHALFDTGAWSIPLWQFALLMMVLALLFSGPGRLSIDALLLGGGGDDGDE
ncbi:MAG: DoxX family protein, partial [Phycisphaerales bacterium]|nr:DoxX family protein [Phycisphaerales bacterium]